MRTLGNVRFGWKADIVAGRRLCDHLAMFKLATLIIAASLSSAAVAGLKDSRWLVTDELEQLLKEWITQPDIRDYHLRNPEYFYEGGEYVRHGDNYEEHGTYRFKDNLICTIAGKGGEVCRMIVLDEKGRYWMFQTLPWPRFDRMEISKIR